MKPAVMNQAVFENVMKNYAAAIMVLALLGCSGDARVLEEGIEAHNLQLESIAIKAPTSTVDPSTGVEQPLFENTNQTITLSIEARNTSGSLISVSSENRFWSIDNPAVATISQNGVVQTHSQGTAIVNVSIGGIVAPEFNLTVSDAPLLGIASIFGDDSVERCIPSTYSAIGDYADSTRALKTVSWGIANDSLGSFSSLSLGQVSVTGANVGALELVATVGDFTASKNIVVNLLFRMKRLLWRQENK